MVAMVLINSWCGCLVVAMVLIHDWTVAEWLMEILGWLLWCC